MRSIAALFIALAGALAAPAMAQDIPGRVGRVAFIEGTAAVYTDPDQGWERAYVNSPLTSENSIWTDPGARAELRVGGTAVRLDQATQVDVARLDDEAFEVFVPRGTVAVRVRHYQRGRDLVVDTPHARFSLRADGRYRIDVDPDLEESRITVFTGDARVGSDSGPVRAKAGQTVRVFGGRPVVVRGRARVQRSVRHLVHAARRALGRDPLGAVRLARHDRLRGPRQLRQLVAGPQLRRRLVSDACRFGLGALSLWTLGLRSPVGLDLDR
jgi:hypothetical protein